MNDLYCTTTIHINIVKEIEPYKSISIDKYLISHIHRLHEYFILLQRYYLNY